MRQCDHAAAAGSTTQVRRRHRRRRADAAAPTRSTRAGWRPRRRGRAPSRRRAPSTAPRDRPATAADAASRCRACRGPVASDGRGRDCRVVARAATPRPVRRRDRARPIGNRSAPCADVEPARSNMTRSSTASTRRRAAVKGAQIGGLLMCIGDPFGPATIAHEEIAPRKNRLIERRIGRAVESESSTERRQNANIRAPPDRTAGRTRGAGAFDEGVGDVVPITRSVSRSARMSSLLVHRSPLSASRAHLHAHARRRVSESLSRSRWRSSPAAGRSSDGGTPSDGERGRPRAATA